MENLKTTHYFKYSKIIECLDTGEKCIGYNDYLKSIHWQNIRLKKLSKQSKCSNGCINNNNLQIHHIHYHSLGNENISTDLYVLCSECHKKIHNIISNPTKIKNLYRVWQNIKQRCYNSNNKDYKHYGGRGIKILEKWKNNYFDFQEWALNNGYINGLTIDRINNDGNYEPDNCRWVSWKTQARNRRYGNRSKTHVGGVCFIKEKNRWRASIKTDKKTIYLGHYKTFEEAVSARKQAQMNYWK